MLNIKVSDHVDTRLAEVFKKYENVEDDMERIEKVAEEVEAVAGDTYVKLDCGLMTVAQLNAFLKSISQEMTFTNTENQFVYYNNHDEEMLAERNASQMGQSTADNHQESSAANVNKVLNMIKTGKLDDLYIPRGLDAEGRYVVHQYHSVRDDDGVYLGVRETVEDLQPVIDWYLEKTGQTLSGGSEDAISNATNKNNKG